MGGIADISLYSATGGGGGTPTNKIKDVQVNGISVVQDGIADITTLQDKITQGSAITTLSDSDVLSSLNLTAKELKDVALSAVNTYIQGKLTGAISGVLTTNLTAGKLLASDSNGKISTSSNSIAADANDTLKSFSVDANGLITGYADYQLYEHYFCLVYKDYASYPNIYGVVSFLFPNDTSRSYAQLAAWLKDNGFNDPNKAYGKISGIQNATSKYVADSSGDSPTTSVAIASVAVGLFSADGETIRLKYNYGSSTNIGEDGTTENAIIIKEFNKVRII